MARITKRDRVASNLACVKCTGQVLPAFTYSGKCCGHTYFVDEDGVIWIDDELEKFYGGAV